MHTWRMGSPKLFNTIGPAPFLSGGWWYLHDDPYLHAPVFKKYCKAQLPVTKSIQQEYSANANIANINNITCHVVKGTF